MVVLRTMSRTCLMGAAIFCALIQTVRAETDAEFFKKKGIVFHIGYGVGGGYDAYARALAHHLSRHVPGKPKIRPQNRPGAGSMRLANELYNVLPQDGSAIGMISRSTPAEVLFGNKLAKFDPTKFNWLGSTNNEVSVCVAWHATGIKTLDKYLHGGTLVGGTGSGSETSTYPKVINNVLGANLKLVFGYPTGTSINLAMERGEVQGRCSWSWTSIKTSNAQWLRENKINVLLQMSTSKHPELTEMKVPWIMDLAKDKRSRQILTLIFASQAMGRPIVAPPGVPENRVKALRAAFDATMKDEAFLKEVRDRKLELASISGVEVQSLVTDIMQTPPDVVQAAKEATEKTGGMFIKKAKVQIVEHSGPVTKIRKGGRTIAIKLKNGKEVMAKVSGSRTAVTLDGKKGSRKAVKVGMSCTFTYPGAGQEAKKLDCRTK